MDFAPYQSSPPEHSRPLSPRSPLGSPRGSVDRARAFSPANAQNTASPPPLQHPQPQRGWQSNLASGPAAYPAADSHREAVSEFDTSLGVRLDYEAAAAYLALPPLGPIVLLILERQSDYVRFHAWQSALLFTALMMFHILFSWSRFLSWVIFFGDLAAMAWLAMKAYQDADTLDRFEVPFFGRIASRILDDE